MTARELVYSWLTQNNMPGASDNTLLASIEVNRVAIWSMMKAAPGRGLKRIDCKMSVGEVIKLLERALTA